MHVHVLDSYRDRTSLIHRLDARVKVLVTALFIVATALTPDGAWPAFMLLLAVAMGVTVISELGIGFVQRRAVLVLPFALAAVAVVFSLPGRALLAFDLFRWHVTITDAGVERFVSILLKSWLSVQMAVVLTASTPFPVLLRAMRGLHLPRVLVSIAGFAYRYVFVIGDEALRMIRARTARSGAPDGWGGGRVAWRARVAGGMVGSLFLRSIERGERIYDAMLARGYDGEVRTLGSPALRVEEGLLVGLFALLMAAIQLLARLTW